MTTINSANINGFHVALVEGGCDDEDCNFTVVEGNLYDDSDADRVEFARIDDAVDYFLARKQALRGMRNMAAQADYDQRWRR